MPRPGAWLSSMPRRNRCRPMRPPGRGGAAWQWPAAWCAGFFAPAIFRGFADRRKSPKTLDKETLHLWGGLQMDAMFWMVLAIGSAAAYGVVILAGHWVFQLGYRGK